ncbi:MAG: nucleotidyltransferase family protein [Gammaproteobacteria bacterium]|nr:nucleotidyltransferase family protein [Gammaproteobacteria bacterium]
MNAMILAAGRGERMRPLTDSTPKPLLTVNDKPLIVYHLEKLQQAGIDSVVINISWLGEQIQQALGDGSAFGLSIDYSHEPEALETAGGIVQALDKLDNRFIVVNADVFTDFDYRHLLDFPVAAHLVLVPNPAHNPAGDFAIEQGYLSNNPDSRYTFAGIAAYEKSFFAGLEPGKRPLAPLLRAGAEQQQVTAELHNGLWNDVGTAERLESLQG